LWCYLFLGVVYSSFVLVFFEKKKKKLATATISTPNGCMQKTANKLIQRSVAFPPLVVEVFVWQLWRRRNGSAVLSCSPSGIEKKKKKKKKSRNALTFLLLRCSSSRLISSPESLHLRLTHAFTVPLKNDSDEDDSRHSHDGRNQCKLGALVTQANLFCARLASNPFVFAELTIMQCISDKCIRQSGFPR
jgi:hypothetical protein